MEDVTEIMTVIDPVDFGAFFDIVSPAIEIHPDNYTVEVKSAFLQAVFDRGNLSSPAINDTEFLLWLRVRLSPLLVNLSPSLVTPLFDIAENRSCNSTQEMITLLDTQHLTLSNNTQREIYESTLLFLQGPTPLKCYSGGSFYIYLRNTFLSFGFPDLSTFTSLLPQTRESELLSTISTSELQQFLSQPNVIDNNSDICVIFDNYNNTPAFLETEDVPDDVKMVTLPCVWPLALSSNSMSEVDSWFDLRLTNYLRFLSKSLISSDEVQNASCLAFQKLVSVMGNNFTYNNSEFGKGDVYTTISTYLRTGPDARCYNASDAELNSTAWFANYIGSFVTFITVDDLTTFTSTSQAEVFLVDQANLELFNNTALAEDVTDYYISQLFEFNPSFNLLKVPGFFLCSPEVPIFAYSSVNEADVMLILHELTEFCNGTADPEVSAALAANIQTLSAETFATLGSASAGLTSSQITSVDPSVLVSSLSTLSSISTWNQQQATTIIQVMTASGSFLINSGSSLESLGTLIAGVPSQSIDNIPASELFSLSQSSAFVSNMLAAPTVVQQTFVQKIISVNSNAASVVQNVPDAMATGIPLSLLDLSAGTVDISVLNAKTWTGDQAAMFFGTLAETNFDIEQLNPSVLQGFTCTSVQRMTKNRIRRLIRACRPRKGRAKVQLKESQLTCMLGQFNGNISQDFTDYPSDMLLYLNNKDVKSANCRSYFSAVGAADFSVASSILNKDSLLLSEAITCLGLSDVNLSKDNVEVLGNMACTLNSSYIQNADPLILEKLQACKDFSDSQVAAIETLLLSGKTQYGNVSTWNKRTLDNLGILPLYLTRQIWGQLKTSTKRRFLKTFMYKLRKTKTKKSKLKVLFREISALRTKRGAGCTVGNITQVTVSDNSFPFGYDQTQFDLCLDIPVLKENLNSICEKVDAEDFQKIILKKLNQAYPSGVSDGEVQVLGSVSRVASLDDISKWSITKPDTLAALMKASDGSWEAAKSKAIITEYLSTSGNSLGSTELNSIDSNLCSLDTSTVSTITPDSIRNVKPLDVASCSLAQKRVLYEISNSSFSSQRSNSITFYNLMKSYLGGAPLQDLVPLSTRNINMDVNTFQSLDPNVINNLTVTDVKGLMGSQKQDLKLFENASRVETWRNLQTQRDLDTLDVGLTTIRIDPTTATPPVTTTPAATPDTTVATTPAVTPATTVTTTPATTPATTVATTPATTPATTVATTPATTPATTVATTPATTLATVTTPATTPATTVATTPATTPATAVTSPATTPATIVTTTPATTLATTVATTPATTPATTVTSPATTPATTVTSPATTPATTVTSPATTPATTVATTPATTPATAVTSPATTPATTVATTTATTPATAVTSPATTPATTVTTPATTPATTVATTPATTPATAVTSPATTPATTVTTTPATTLATTVATTPATTPATTVTSPATTPATTVTSPATTPATTVTSPATTPATTVTSPATTPATTVATTPATTPATAVTSPATTPATTVTTPATTPATAVTTPATTPATAVTTPATTPATTVTTPATTPATTVTTPATTPSTAVTTTPATTPATTVTTPAATPATTVTTPAATPSTTVTTTPAATPGTTLTTTPAATLTTTVTTTANATSGGALLSKHPTSILVAALLTIVLQILQQLA
ncbi:mucin-3A-like [Sebastes umbrosus]|uniref:mucin-3A-like n=1 Tax=Sebastes umbrosus TaxID=72105 RepID=UPI0018A0FF38|nr:mucin-3A-like [Sebastes umbrosus]